MSAKQIKVTQIKSKNGRLAAHKACLLGLGIRRMHNAVRVDDTAANRGMITKVSYMLKIEEL
ncbi:MAG TPA: 50S ribosomal protein L30 [Methylococcaceae bacterium]|jgi:large subunit ribosomal protein L30|nr:50S ribosomal protein L30 [Methylococcaceae bacterium]